MDKNNAEDAKQMSSKEADEALRTSEELTKIEDRMARIVDKLNKYIQCNGCSDKLKRRSKLWVKRLNLDE